MSLIDPQDAPLIGTVGGQAPAAEQKKVLSFTILHTNDMHSNLIGVGPASEYSPMTLNDDRTIGGIERIASLIAERRKAREAIGPVLVLDVGDFSIGTPFGGATHETGAELQCLSMAGYDATTFGNHEFDAGPEALAKAIAAAKKAGHVPPILAANTHFDGDDAGLSQFKGTCTGGTDPEPYAAGAWWGPVRSVRHDGNRLHSIHDQPRSGHLLRPDRDRAEGGEATARRRR